ncbi:MAG TPA: hypothetical protein PKC41_03815 [Chitinophagaceae bacterium]|nr:hypothetical protein [Chitinophagaceae bacterium]
MIFRRYYTFQSKQNADTLKQKLLGQHLKVHNLDFVIFDKGDSIKVIPHAESDEHVHTLPITNLKIKENGTGCTIKMMSKPRRIDIGGPYLLMMFVFFAVIAGLLLYLYGEGAYNNTAYILVGIAVLIFLLLYIRMQQGYFDYIRKIKKWVGEHI